MALRLPRKPFSGPLTRFSTYALPCHPEEQLPPGGWGGRQVKRVFEKEQESHPLGSPGPRPAPRVQEAERTRVRVLGVGAPLLNSETRAPLAPAGPLSCPAGFCHGGCVGGWAGSFLFSTLSGPVHPTSLGLKGPIPGHPQSWAHQTADHLSCSIGHSLARS